MNISDTASELVDLIQTETSNKLSKPKICKQVAALLNKLVDNLRTAQEETEYVIVINLDQGMPSSVTTNAPELNGALFVCTDDISLADDVDSAILVGEETLIIGTGVIEMEDDMRKYVRSAVKFERLNG